MECFHCKGRMMRKVAPFSVDRKGYHITWEAIPAWVCTQCGEPFFEEKETNHIQMALRKIDHETMVLTSKAA
uniref:YgiT-type zinc finger domain-containing protein n=1 Tax=Candidatus Kentrum eta TaxID=2126337 RepID=A0A450UVG0_9GAMM|nr:MAG: YgiT-type zinc finger domain-containing protein [Candidatus Kentron sp. H]VFJ97974.1 MAG: YgiT-type zinc finger domain-containing protein [Candidatus Kentron sp. H]VFK03116.1 MAG: YgiT-type zinc finger domain-containing protein [Candidatus Kentron sp. H]